MSAQIHRLGLSLVCAHHVIPTTNPSAPQKPCSYARIPLATATHTCYTRLTVACALARYRHVLPILARAVKKRPRTTLGLHLEGPFLDPTPGARGSHKADRIREPDTAFLAELLALADGTVKILTVAAGRPGCSKLIKAAVAAGIHVALGHHMATLEQLEEAVEAGATMLTHLGNGAPNQVCGWYFIQLYTTLNLALHTCVCVCVCVCVCLTCAK